MPALVMQVKYKEEMRLQGIPISGGIASSGICLFNENRHANLPQFKVQGEGIEREVNRLQRAISLTIEQLGAMKQEVAVRVGPSEAEIFTAQAMILQDDALQKQMLEMIREKKANAESAIMDVLEAHELRLLSVDNEYIKDRASDIGEIKRRMLDALGNMRPALQCAGQPHCHKGKARIVVADELTPSLTMGLDTVHTLGFVTERGGKTSHAAILARALGIPAVTGIHGIHGAITCGTEILVNGNTGEVVIWPTAATLNSMLSVQPLPEPAPMAILPVPGLQVMANVTTTADVAEAHAMLAEGIGLYRTEFEYFAAGRLLTEEEQFVKYSAVLKAMNGRPVTIRLLDIGGDKTAPYFDIPPEPNPYLGFRGSRLLLARDDLLAPQARALARASALGPLRVLYPMIVEVEQFVAMKRRFAEVVHGLDASKLTHGVMFEVPSACLQASELLAAADFASIGSNDLIQYLFAVDRNNDRVAYDYSPDRPVFWRLIGEIARAAKEQGKSLSLCGEMAGDPGFTRKLIGLGIGAVSVSAKLIPAVRKAVLAAPR